MTVPFLDLKAAYRELKPAIDAAALRVLDSGRYINGNEVEAFENDFAAYCHANHCVGLGNGLDAITLALRCLGIGSGDEVIVPSNTFIATWLAVSIIGAQPVPVEPDPTTYNIDACAVRRAVTKRTRAIIVVHLYGQPADLDGLRACADELGLPLIEDAAQAHGALYKGRPIGAHGDIVCWSFYPGKNLGAMGDGGAITTDVRDLADEVRKLSNYGSTVKYRHEIPGVNSRLDPIQAAILQVKLRYLDEWVQRRRAIASRYLQELDSQIVTVPAVANGVDPAWHLFVVRSERRDALQAHLRHCEVETLVHYPTPPHMQPAYARLGMSPNRFPIAAGQADQLLSLPIGPHLSEQQVSQVIDAVNRFK
ncbi:DegT/DnrJ/EryC1/StrS family aminotransferase [Novosphingobium jiangmenense]|uniref:DegT/DnrJ/EryC1/StrS family aminotransferase n=1 Tax=Novosphingobium jiangmenense TaxID=2791981 RepID=A0ABS0HM37_9SPHN|nr:DegT/DnrJ/EryC1/StrS family aminotransferase [Novosphingobium jiangmenense]MBF9153054.1 DegT/DnrJ/EryC1/StrS family aminotransferase [Novosphingobium jiangmenense]